MIEEEEVRELFSESDNDAEFYGFEESEMSPNTRRENTEDSENSDSSSIANNRRSSRNKVKKKIFTYHRVGGDPIREIK